MTTGKEPGADPGAGGLLSKVVKFVRSPTTQWADLERPDAPERAADSRIALKEMIERKRRNDFVRNREFDMLRKVRRREASGDSENAGLPSLDASSMPAALDEREQTLKKIDEIEAQMSYAWFKRKSEGAAGEAAPQPPAQPPAAAAPGAADARGAAPRPELGTSPGALAFAPTMTAESMEPAASPAAPEAQPPARSAQPSGMRASGLPGELAPLDVEVMAQAKHDPEVEEAAIRFANGDADGAEAGLLELLKEGGAHRREVETWLTLFDFYRAIGAQSRFDETAIEFANLFGRSAPQWSMGLNTVFAPPTTLPPPAAIAVGSFHWTCPSVLGAQSMAALNASLLRGTPPWRIDWRHVKSIDHAALGALTAVLQRWAETPVQFKFRGVERLLAVLAEHSPSDDRTVDQAWWVARLALLRVMGRMDEFDVTALNYCVTYEVSPPAWEEPRNSYVSLSDEGQTIPQIDTALMPPGGVSSSLHGVSTFGGTSSFLEGGAHRVELSGEILGTAERALASAQGSGTETGSIEFMCRSLRRVDFGAAGDLLNWVTAQEAAGRSVSFQQLNRMVAAFFGVIGINEFARITLRVD